MVKENVRQSIKNTKVPVKISVSRSELMTFETGCPAASRKSKKEENRRRRKGEIDKEAQEKSHVCFVTEIFKNGKNFQMAKIFKTGQTF